MSENDVFHVQNSTRDDLYAYLVRTKRISADKEFLHAMKEFDAISSTIQYQEYLRKRLQRKTIQHEQAQREIRGKIAELEKRFEDNQRNFREEQSQITMRLLPMTTLERFRQRLATVRSKMSKYYLQKCLSNDRKKSLKTELSKS